MAEGGQIFSYFAKVTFAIVCVIWLLATIFCTPLGRWLRRVNPRARRPFYYDPAQTAGSEQESHELEDLEDGRGRIRRTRVGTDFTALNNRRREHMYGSRSSTTAEYGSEC